jgi:diguanylate cyclase (GGDEF)-like protein
MVVRGRTVGFLNVNSSRAGFYTQEYADRLQAFAEHAALAIDNARIFDEAKQLAYTDELTGLYNRRGLVEAGRREVERSYRYEHKLSAILMDIDHFKLVNDTYGHGAGDQVLGLIGDRFRTGLRWSDIVGRYGGEEFLVLLPEADLKGAMRAAERLRKLISGDPYQLEECELRLTVSLGVAMMDASFSDLGELIKRADDALYLAKQSGRNRVIAVNGNGGERA